MAERFGLLEPNLVDTFGFGVIALLDRLLPSSHSRFPRLFLAREIQHEQAAPHGCSRVLCWEREIQKDQAAHRDGEEWRSWHFLSRASHIYRGHHRIHD